MKIIESSLRPNTVKLEQIHFGGIFRAEGNCWIKTIPPTTVSGYTCVNLHHGRLVNFVTDHQVIPVKAYIKIERYLSPEELN